MSAYVLHTDSGHLEWDHGAPDVIGPFATIAEAKAWVGARYDELWIPNDGGYATCLVIGDEAPVDYTPEGWDALRKEIAGAVDEASA
jgi:hypothetical protein